jgi:outer membrane protein assembly factor BamA
MFGREVVTNFFVTGSQEHFAPETEFDLDLVERLSEFTLEQRFRPANDMAVTYGYSFGFIHNFEREPDPDSFLPPHDVSTRIARLTSTYAWDTRDDPANAARGWLHSSGLEFGSQAIGSNLRFLKYLAQQYYFHSVTDGVVLASAFRLGAGRGFGGQDLDEKFRAGGGTTVRGFAEDSLGEADFFGPTGGNALLLLNQELRFPIFKWLRGVGFFDAGNVFTTAGELSFANLEAGAGAGLRLDSPFVLLRLDFGVPLTRRDEERSGRWYFAIGQTF